MSEPTQLLDQVEGDQEDRRPPCPARPADQAETDRYWNAIVGNGGQESACGWCKDKWGLSWQITPVALTKAIADPDQRDSHARLKENLAFQQKSMTEAEARPRYSDAIRVRMIRPAERAGDAAVVRQGYDAWLAELDRQMNDRPDDERIKFDKADRLREYAIAVATLTGNRAEAAALWRQADQLARVKDDSGSDKKRALPAWFPPGR